jgi:hypothetical protein
MPEKTLTWWISPYLGHMDTIHPMAALVGKDRIEGVEDPRRQVPEHHFAAVSDPGQ